MSGAVLFVWRRSPPPFFIGGAEVSQRLLAEEFAAAGWIVAYLGTHETPWDGAGELDDMREFLDHEHIDIADHAFPDGIRYTWRGVDCHAVPQAGIEDALSLLLRNLRPDLVITAQEGAAALTELASQHAPVAGWLHSVSATGLGVLRGRPRHALATSAFVLREVGDVPGAVRFYPPFEAHCAAAGATFSGDDILMINPVPAKGGDLVHRLAGLLPERRFTVVEGWWDTADRFAGLPNVSYRRRTHAVHGLYNTHRILIVPSNVRDAFPRVIIEAGLAGLPTIGSQRGGIPEAVGPGGIVLPTDQPAPWAAAIQSMTPGQQAHYGELARAHAGSFVRHCLPELAEAGIIPS